MALDLPLDDMSTEEKLLLIENIWDNIRQSAEDLDSPGWHEESLEERKQAIEEGRSQFVDWDKAKENIRNAIK